MHLLSPLSLKLPFYEHKNVPRNSIEMGQEPPQGGPHLANTVAVIVEILVARCLQADVTHELMFDLDITNCPDSANITISVEGTVSVQSDVNQELMFDLDITNCPDSANITISVEGTVSVQADVNQALMFDIDITNCTNSSSITISVEGTVSVQANVNQELTLT